MRASATSLLTVLALATGGCASTINALTNRPVTSDVLDEWKNGRAQELNKLKTVSGDRRLVRVQAYNPTSANWTICAETQADAIAARGAQSGLSIDSRGKVD